MREIRRVKALPVALVLAGQSAKTLHLIGETTGPQRVPQGRGIDGDDRFIEPALRLIREAQHRQIRAASSHAPAPVVTLRPPDNALTRAIKSALTARPPPSCSAME